MTNRVQAFRSLVVAAVCLLGLAQRAAAEVVIQAPASVPVGGLCIIRVDGLAEDASISWATVPEVETADLMQRDGTPVLFVGTSKPGTYSFVLAYLENNQVAQQVATVVIGTPSPVPPGPEPTPVPPTPQPTPTPAAGPRVVWIVYESTQTTVPFGQLMTSIRQPPHSTYLLDHKHVLAIIDDDIVDENGQPPREVIAMRPHVDGMTLPVLLIADRATNKLIHKQEIPANATAGQVIDVVKEHD